MSVKKSYTSKKSEYTATYRDMLGVDFSTEGAGISTRRFAYAENMYRDYEGGGAALTESIPGFRKILETGKRINGIYSRHSANSGVHIVIHAGDSLYTLPLSELDSAGELSPIFTAVDEKSHARAFGSTLYVFDSAGIIAVSDEGAVRASDEGELAPYVPTTYLNGREFEQRNLLTPKFSERTFIGSCSEYGHGTRGFSYEILSEADGFAKLTSGGGASGVIYVPSLVKINGTHYTVSEIGAGAFRENTAITEVHISEGVRVIGKQAFADCSSLLRVFTPDSIEEICTSAFENCVNLEKFHLGGGMKRYGAKVFLGCEKLSELEYAMNLTAYAEIENQSENLNFTVLLNKSNLTRAVEIPIHTPTECVSRVTLDGADIAYALIHDGTLAEAVVIETDDKYTLEGHELEIFGLVCDRDPRSSPTVPDFLLDCDIGAREAIIGCRVSESFDGRIFLSGNPALPNAVFWAQRDSTGRVNPLYFGALNYFTDGVGGYTVTSLLAASNMLAVFKSGDDGCGSIFYHTAQDTESDITPRIYPVAYVHSGLYSNGPSISFFDDPLFVSPKGVCSLEKQSINLERSIVCRSHNVNARLLREKASKIRLAEWCGYLVVLAEGRVYLADSRATFTHATGGVEYEWYYLEGVGTYKNDRPVYAYASVAHEGFECRGGREKIDSSGVYSTTVGEDTVYYLPTEDGKKIELTRTGEMTGGDFSAATELLTVSGYLIFGTASGDVCVFNNDKRGVPPERIRSLPDFDAAEYESRMGRRIHTDYYSFANHAPRYALITAFDNCGLPNLTKSTVKNSFAVKCRAFTSSNLICEVGTDKDGYSETASFPAGELDFSSLDFSTLSANTSGSFTVPIAERERGWVEKQIAFYSDEYSSPFGIYSISYRFTLKGNVKKQ